MPRRAFAKYGALSTGLLVGSSGMTAGRSRADTESKEEAVEQGIMPPYQVVPGARITVVERDIGWQPQGLESHQASVISYDHAPSLRAVLLTDVPLRTDRSVAIGDTRGVVSETNRSLVTVGLDSRVADGSER